MLCKENDALAMQLGTKTNSQLVKKKLYGSSKRLSLRGKNIKMANIKGQRNLKKFMQIIF
jgi:hypothetical protein